MEIPMADKTAPLHWNATIIPIPGKRVMNNKKELSNHRPLTRYVKLRVAQAPGISGTFSPPPRVSDPNMHHSTCVTQAPWCMPGLLTSGFLWSRWRGKGSRHCRRMRNQQFYVSGKRPMAYTCNDTNSTIAGSRPHSQLPQRDEYTV